MTGVQTCALPISCIGAGGKLLSSKAKSFEERLHPLMAVRECDMSAIQQIVANARASEFGKLLELHSDRALFERRFDAEIEGVPCKCKPDLLILLSDQAIICDLKVGVVKPDDFWRNAKNFGYSLQASHYSKIVKKVYGLPVTWRFWALESSFPYRVEPYWYEDRSMEIANDSHRDLLRKLKRCYETGVWVDNFEHEKVLSPWDVSYKGESVTPEELTLGLPSPEIPRRRGSWQLLSGLPQVLHMEISVGCCYLSFCKHLSLQICPNFSSISICKLKIPISCSR